MSGLVGVQAPREDDATCREARPRRGVHAGHRRDALADPLGGQAGVDHGAPRAGAVGEEAVDAAQRSAKHPSVRRLGPAVRVVLGGDQRLPVGDRLRRGPPAAEHVRVDRVGVAQARRKPRGEAFVGTH